MFSIVSDALATEPASTTNDASTETPGAVPYELSAEKMMSQDFMLIGMIFCIFYFILLRPQQRMNKVHKELIKSLQKGNKIMTSGGIVGTIIKFDGDDMMVLEVAPSIRLRMARSAATQMMDDKIAIGESANDN